MLISAHIFNRAIDGIGSNKWEIRLKGLAIQEGAYAVERVGKWSGSVGS